MNNFTRAVYLHWYYFFALIITVFGYKNKAVNNIGAFVYMILL